jgi:predicted glycosyltransferase
VINFNDMPLKHHTFEYKYITPVTRLTAPFSSVLFKPFMVDDEIFRKLGVENIKTYNFIDPLIWLKDFKYNFKYVKKILKDYKMDYNKTTIVIREEEYKSSYVDKKYPIIYEALEEIKDLTNSNIIIIPRYESEYLKKEFPFAIVLEEKVEIQHLLYFCDLFIGSGGTINTAACFLGTPTISTRSFISHYDRFLIDNDLMLHSNDAKEIVALSKKLMMTNNKLIANNIFSRMELDIDKFVNPIVELTKS